MAFLGLQPDLPGSKHHGERPRHGADNGPQQPRVHISNVNAPVSTGHSTALLSGAYRSPAAEGEQAAVFISEANMNLFS